MSKRLDGCIFCDPSQCACGPQKRQVKPKKKVDQQLAQTVPATKLDAVPVPTKPALRAAMKSAIIAPQVAEQLAAKSCLPGGVQVAETQSTIHAPATPRYREAIQEEAALQRDANAELARAIAALAPLLHADELINHAGLLVTPEAKAVSWRRRRNGG